MKWKLLSKKILLPMFHSTIQLWNMQIPNGRTKEFFVTDGYDIALVLAIDSDGRAVIVKQFYISQQKKLISLPAGIIEKNESPKKAAIRELLEETGYKAKKFIALGKSNKGKYVTGNLYHFLALDAQKVQKPNLEQGEDITVLTCSIAELKHLLNQGKLPSVFVEVCARRGLVYLDNLTRK